MEPIQAKDQTRRELLADLATQLWKLQQANSPEIQLVLRFLLLLHDETKDRLLQATPLTFAPLQGEAVAYLDIVRRILNSKPLPKD